MALIEMKGVAKKYHRSTTALRDINVSINPGEFVYIVGPSGAGKSSFIKLLYREEKVSAGTLKVGEFNLTKMKNVKSRFYVVALALSSKITNFFLRRLFLKTLLLHWKSQIHLKSKLEKKYVEH